MVQHRYQMKILFQGQRVTQVKQVKMPIVRVLMEKKAESESLLKRTVSTKQVKQMLKWGDKGSTVFCSQQMTLKWFLIPLKRQWLRIKIFQVQQFVPDM